MFKKTITHSSKVKKLPPSSPKDFRELESIASHLSDDQGSFVEISFLDSDGERVAIQDQLDFEYFSIQVAENKLRWELDVRCKPQSSLGNSKSGFIVLEEEKERIKPAAEVHLSEKATQKEEEDLLLPISSHDQFSLHNLLEQLSHSSRGSALHPRPSKNRRNHRGFQLESLQIERCFEEATHDGVGCDECGIFPIIGTRYRCISHCRADICSNCEKKNHSHLMLRIPNKVSESSLVKFLDRLQTDEQLQELEMNQQKIE